jgi:D-alanine-D-alanine ligase
VKVALIYNKTEILDSDVIYRFGMPTKERYKPITIEMATEGLRSGGHEVAVIEGNKDVIAGLEAFMPPAQAGGPMGMVFNMAYGVQGLSRYTHIPAILELVGIPYLGSSPVGHAIALDKVLSKILFQRDGLPTPDFWVFSGADEDISGVHYPVIVKPKMEAVSFGVRVVRQESDLRAAIAFVLSEFKQDALVEQFIPGREYAVSLVGNGESLEALPIVEIDLESDPDGIQTYEEKMHKPRKKICPVDIDPFLDAKLKQLSKDAFNALGLFDFARVDFRVTPNGNPYILEINSMASLNPTGSFVMSGGVAGMPFGDLVNKMLDVACDRYLITR